MGETRNIHDLMASFLAALTEGQKREIQNLSDPQGDMRELVSYLWKLPQTRQYLTPAVIRRKKSEARSEEIREKGNRFFSKKARRKALEAYNLSIIAAPHPDVMTETTLEGEYKTLALGFANRSAVLFELGEYERCMHDIERAFRYGYPSTSRCKLIERKAKCLRAMMRTSEATEVLDTAIGTLADLPLENTATIRERLSRLVIECQQKENTELTSVEHQTSANSTLSPKEQLLFAYSCPTPPVLNDPQPNIPSLSLAVRVAYSPSKGRHLIAERAIHPGEILIVEKSFASTTQLSTTASLIHCATCLSYCLTPLPCPACEEVIFCSEECRQLGLESNHKLECQIRLTLQQLKLDDDSVLAFKILDRVSFAELEESWPRLQRERKVVSPAERGFDERGTYQSSGYRSVFHLLTHQHQKPFQRFLMLGAQAFVLTKLLEQCGYFRRSGELFQPSLEDLVLVSTALCHHILVLEGNGHAISDIKLNTANYRRSTQEAIGKALFPSLALGGHSCCASSHPTFYGNVVVLRALRYIAVGEEVSQTYTVSVGFTPLPQRKNHLKKSYHFDCTCEACENKWPLRSHMPVEVKLKCLSCFESIDVDLGKCSGCELDYTKIQTLQDGKQTYNWMDVFEQFADDKYLKLFSRHNNLPKAEDFQIICDFIELLDKYVQLPVGIYFDTLDTLKTLFDMQCNHMQDVSYNYA